MVRFKKIRPRRGSLAVSIVWGSPIAASNRSAALAYLIGSLRHDSRYSAIDMSVWLLASKDRAKALNRESLYMIRLSMVTCKCRTLQSGSYRSVTATVRESPSVHAPIGHASVSTLQCNSHAKDACLVKIRCHFARVVSGLQHFHRTSTEQHVRDFLRIPSGRAGSNRR